jgi:inosine-uridine nucleoside N-ribohydrolase
VTLRLWVDTDIGDNPDDAVALLCAAAHPGVDLVGLSTVGGDVTARAELATEVLAGAGQRVPLVYAGPPDPRAIQIAEAVLAIGPCTNLAALLRSGVDLPPIAVMGGVISPTLHRGEVRTTETNFAADPLAAAVVVAHAADVLLVPLDVTARMTIDDVTTARLADAGGLGSAIEAWRGSGLPVCLHDPLALLALVGEHVRVERHRVGVSVEGRVVLDADGGVEQDLVTDADVGAATQRILDLVMS